MSNIKPVHMYQSGPIPGLAGIFSGGQTVYVDFDTMEVVSQVPMLQRPDNEEPLAKPKQSKGALKAKAKSEDK